VRKSWIPVFLIWLLYTILGVLLVQYTTVLPAQFSHEAEVIDEAYELLEVLAIPVMALVLAIMTWGAIAWRSTGAEREDGPPQRNSTVIVTVWLVVTTALAIGILINPGFKGLTDLRGEANQDYVIELEARQFSWTVIYPNGESSVSELVVPLDKRVRYDVTSVTDSAENPAVLHSFWVPAFRTKIDAVPGRTTQVRITATEVGGMDDDVNLRIQCAELCGAGHATMMLPVRVVTDADWNDYVESLKADG
jgi:cytochrome c oxidase subunit 2